MCLLPCRLQGVGCWGNALGWGRGPLPMTDPADCAILGGDAPLPHLAQGLTFTLDQAAASTSAAADRSSGVRNAES